MNKYFIIVCLVLLVNQSLSNIADRELQMTTDKLYPIDKSKAQNIRIYVDYSNIRLGNKITDQQVAFLKKVMDVVITFYSNRLKVNPVQGNLTISQIDTESCEIGGTLPQFLKSGGYGVAADVILSILAFDEDSGAAAQGMGCGFEQSNRPNAGLVRFSTQTLGNDFSNTQFKYFVDATIHEVAHVLVLQWDYFKNTNNKGFRDELGKLRGDIVLNGTFRGKQNYILTSPNIVNYVRTYFNCPTALGAELENDGPDGTPRFHWERSIFNGDILQGMMENYGIFTGLDAALYQDSGFYLVDTTKVSNNLWGKDAGCDFLNLNTKNLTQTKQVNNVEFCDDTAAKAQQRGCSFDLQNIGQCYQNQMMMLDDKLNFYNPLTDNSTWCYDDRNNYNNLTKKSGQTFGINSVCLKQTLSDSSRVKGFGCYEVNLDSNKKVQIKIDSITYNCDSTGQQIQVKDYNGYITCPDIQKASFLIQNPLFCKDFCSQNGYCMKGKCECNKEWTGDYCQLKANKYNSFANILNKFEILIFFILLLNIIY